DDEQMLTIQVVLSERSTSLRSRPSIQNSWSCRSCGSCAEDIGGRLESSAIVSICLSGATGSSAHILERHPSDISHEGPRAKRPCPCTAHTRLGSGAVSPVRWRQQGV